MATDPPRAPSVEELGVLVQQLAVSVAAIHERIDRLEQRDRERTSAPISGRTQPPATIPSPPSPIAPAPVGRVAPGQPWMGPAVAVPPRAPWWQVGPLESVTPDKAPIVALAAAGGLAVLVGMLFFVWYAVERGWLSPITRLWLGGAAGLAMLVAAWPLAQRNRSVAGGLGGAGLGTWFGVWIVARHVHGVVGPTATFVGLAVVAAACLVVAGARQLRLMAILAALAAFATPIATATGADRLHELLAYQLVVMAALVALEHVRRWPELGHIAVVGTWLLIAGWAEQHLQPATEDKLLGWTLVLLVATSAQTVLLRVRGLPGAHAAGRQLAGGLFAWSAVVAAAWDRDDLFAWTTLGMAMWHLGLLGWSRLRGPCTSLHAVLLGLGWALLLAFGPIQFQGNARPGWWLAQGLVGALTVALGRGWLPVRLATAPLLGVLAWVLEADHGNTGLAFGLAVAAVLVMIALWPAGRAQPGDPEPDGTMAILLLVLASLLAGAMVERHLGPTRTSQAALAMVVVGVLATARAWLRLDAPRVKGAVAGLALGLAWAVAHTWLDRLLEDPTQGAARATIAAAAVLAGAAGLSLVVLLRRRVPQLVGVAETHDLAGVVVVLGVGVALQMGVASWLFTQLPGHAGLRSLVVASISVIAAVAALAGLVAGLRFQREPWRKLALGGLVAVAVKVVLVDLSEVDVAYRVLSFVGLGACMLLGAIAYGRALRRYGPPAK